MATEDGRLDSWKAIADHFGRDVRTVIRWEKERGLPVRRVPGGRGRTVFAYTSDLDAWLAGANAPTPAELAPSAPARFPRLAVVSLLVVTAVVVTGLSVGLTSFAAPPIVRVVGGESAIKALDADGRVRWTYPVPGLSTGFVVNPQNTKLEDLDGDGRAEVVLALEVSHAADYRGELIVLDADGRLRWKRTLEGRYTFGGTEYSPGWPPDSVIVYRVAGRARVSVAQHHHLWWPDIIATFDESGAPLSHFVNSGWIYSLDTSADGKYVLAAGVSNALGGAVLAVFDAANVSGASPAGVPSATPPCDNCPAGGPLAYFVVPWSDVARSSDSPRSTVGVSSAGEINFHALQSGLVPDAPDVIVTLSSSLEIKHRAPSDGFWSAHATYEKQGLLKHTAADCPWRKSVPIRKWTLQSGWQEIR